VTLAGQYAKCLQLWASVVPGEESRGRIKSWGEMIITKCCSLFSKTNVLLPSVKDHENKKIKIKKTEKMAQTDGDDPQIATPITSCKKKKKLHHFSHIRLIRRPINNEGWNSCIISSGKRNPISGALLSTGSPHLLIQAL
jgi:hypothetical protein